MGLTGSAPPRMSAVLQEELGDADVLRLAELPVPEPRSGRPLVEVALAGVNFGDLLGRRTGNNHIAKGEVPFVPGSEVVGRRVDTGQRVLALCGLGGYAEYVAARDDRMFGVPDDIDDATALALFVAGVTAWALLRTGGPAVSGRSVVVHAASGGVGSIATQLAVAFGAARVIGTASSPRRCEVARAHGAHSVVDSRPDGLADRLVAANDGRPVDLVLDCSGGSAFAQSLAALAPFGRVVLFGTPRGASEAVAPAGLITGSRSIGGFWLLDCFAVAGLVDTALTELFDLTRSGALSPVIGQVLPLADVVTAHRLLESRASVGKLMLAPSAGGSAPRTADLDHVGTVG
jgi:NADPH:quinone reductase